MTVDELIDKLRAVSAAGKGNWDVCTSARVAAGHGEPSYSYHAPIRGLNETEEETVMYGAKSGKTVIALN